MTRSSIGASPKSGSSNRLEEHVSSTAPAPGESGYTAGPWNIRPEPFERNGASYKSRLIGANIGPRGESIRHDGDVLNDGVWVAETKGPDADANARLIAAAPDMLAALIAAEEDLAEEAKCLRDSCSCNGVLDEESADEVARLDALVIQVRAAIAKALSPDLSGGEG